MGFEHREDADEASWADDEPSDRVELSNHPHVMRQTEQGGCLVLFGVPFMGVGVAVILAGMGVIPMESDGDAPLWVLYVFGAIFGLAGLGISSMGIRTMLNRAHYRRAFRRHADEPWRAEGWDERRAKNLKAGFFSFFVGAAALGLFLSPFNYFVFYADKGAPCFAQGIVGLFDLILIALVGNGVYRLFQQMKYWDGALLLDRFPFFTRSGVAVRFQPPRALAHTRGWDTLKVTFRCVEQAWEDRGGDSNTMVTTQRFAEERRIPARDLGTELRLEFSLPKGAPSTDLGATPAVFYTLELEAETPGIDYHALYQLPVYEG